MSPDAKGAARALGCEGVQQSRASAGANGHSEAREDTRERMLPLAKPRPQTQGRGEQATCPAAGGPALRLPEPAALLMETEFIKVRARSTPHVRGREEIKAHLTPCRPPETLTNPTLPKTIIGQNNSSLEINWTNYVGSRNALNDYPLSGRVSVVNL